MTGYVNEIYRCAVCLKTFPKYVALKRHLLTEHAEGQLYTCKYCDKRFSQKSNMQRHSKKHTGVRPFSCGICSKDFTQKANLERHMAIHTGHKPYACNFCDKKFAQNVNLKTHLLRHTGDRPFKCHVCNKAFTAKGNLQMHLVRHANNQCHICQICNEGFLAADKYNQHMLTHDVVPVFSCQVCLNNFESEAQLNEHLKIHGSHAREVICKKMTDKTMGNNNLLQHSKNMLYVCDICKEGFLDKNQFRNHVLAHNKKHLNSFNTSTKKSKSRGRINYFKENTPHVCTICSKKFTQKYNLNRHLRTHSDEYYTCNICNEKFNHQSNFKRHLALHSNFKPYTCDMCPKAFFQKSNLKRHLLTHSKQLEEVEYLHAVNDESIRSANSGDYEQTEYYHHSTNNVAQELPSESDNLNVSIDEGRLSPGNEIYADEHSSTNEYVYEQNRAPENEISVNTDISKLFQSSMQKGDVSPDFSVSVKHEVEQSGLNGTGITINEGDQPPDGDAYDDRYDNDQQKCLSPSESTSSKNSHYANFYICDQCGEFFTENYRLEQHLLTHSDHPIIVIVI